MILTGSRTGSPVDPALLDTVRAAVGEFPIWIGSGMDLDSASTLWPMCDGAIIGSSLQAGGVAGQAVEEQRVRAMRDALTA